MADKIIEDLDKVWEAVNALGGYVAPRDDVGNGYSKAIDDALAAIEALGGRDPARMMVSPKQQDKACTMTAPEAFEKWWQELSLLDGTLTYDHIRQAWDAGVLFEREAAAVIAENFVLGETADGRAVWADDVAKEIRDQRD